MTRKSFLFLLTLLTAIVMTLPAMAEQPAVETGQATRTKAIFKVYTVWGRIASKVAKSGQAVVDADLNKTLVLKFHRDVSKDKITDAFSETIGPGATKDKLVAAFPAEIKENAVVSISYNAETKITTINAQGGSTQTVSGVEAMKDVFAIWYVKIKDSDVRNGLISKL